MNEIEKLYENCEIKKKRMCEWTCRGNEFCSTNCEHYESTKEFYPPFTAEKQLSLTTFIGLHYGFQMFKNEAFDYIIATRIYVKFEYEYKGYGYGYDEAIANLINNIWQDLTEEEKEQIRGVLNG